MAKAKRELNAWYARRWPLHNEELKTKKLIGGAIAVAGGLTLAAFLAFSNSEASAEEPTPQEILRYTP